MGSRRFCWRGILWGVAWSSLRQGGYVAIWTGDGARKGRLTGLLWGLVRLGSALSVLAGGLLYDRYGYRSAVGAIAFVTALAVPIAIFLPWRNIASADDSTVSSIASRETQPPATVRDGWRAMWVNPVRRWLTASSMVGHFVNGVVLSTTSLFLAQRLPEDRTVFLLGIGVGTLAGLMLGARWLSDMVLGPAFGYLSDRTGQANMALGLAILYVLGLAGVISLPIAGAVLCLLLVFVCDGGLYIALNAAASGAAMASSRPHRFIGVFTTASDAGSALGPLVAFSAATVVGFPSLYAIGGLGILLTVFWFWRVSRRTSAAKDRL